MRNPGIISLIASIMLMACSNQEPVMPQGTVIALSDAFTGEYQLTDYNGAEQTQNSFQGKSTLIYFGFTSCPDVCPSALNIMSAALNEMGNAAQDIQPLFITVDPERDSRELIKSYLSFDERILGLTGTASEIETAKNAFKVYAQKRPLPDSALVYDVNHSSLFYFVAPNGVPKFALKDTISPQDLAEFISYHSKN